MIKLLTNITGVDWIPHVSLNFLGSGKYEVTIVQDGENAHYLTNREVMKVQTQMLNAKDTVHVKLAPGGGACLIIKAI
jgi:alpha-glucosidase